MRALLASSPSVAHSLGAMRSQFIPMIAVQAVIPFLAGAAYLFLRRPVNGA